MTRPSDKKFASVRKKYGKRFVMGITIGSTVNVTRGVIRAYLIFKHEFNNTSYKLSL